MGSTGNPAADKNKRKKRNHAGGKICSQDQSQALKKKECFRCFHQSYLKVRKNLQLAGNL
jgi:uncharacterized paraquat-inducible protein A